MKNKKNIQRIIVFILLIVISCTSVVYSAAQVTIESRNGYSGTVEPVIYAGDGTGNQTLQMNYSYLDVESNNSMTIKFGEETHTLSLSVQNGNVVALLDGSTSMGTITISSSSGRQVGSIPGTATSQDNGSIRIGLGTDLTADNLKNLKISFKIGEKSYEGSLGEINVRTMETRRESAGWDNFGQFAGELLTNLLWGDLAKTILRLVNYLLNQLLIPLGDGVIGLVSRSVGEAVTIDRIIFGKIDKISVDYWTKGNNGSVKSIMSDVVNTWYGTFRSIAVIVYMIMLVYVGIMIMLNSTAENKAKYKGFFVSWVVGICMLFFFPYVMKYIVSLNNAVVRIMETYMGSHSGLIGGVSESADIPIIINSSTETVNEAYGKNDFLLLMNYKENNGTSNSTTNIMMTIRMIAASTDQVFMTIIYLILIGEMVVLLVMYYKRAFMVAFLITIFPLVAMTYVIDKAGDRKAQSFEIWFKEYIVNIVVQIFHAVVYVLVVGSAVQGFISYGGKNWIFLLVSVLFLFQGEKILRGIFGIKSSANTIGDLATTGLAVFGAARSLGGLAGKNNNENASEDDKNEQSKIEERKSQRSSMSGSETNAAANARKEIAGAGAGNNGNTSGNGSTSGNYGQDTGNDQPGVENNVYSHQAAMDVLAPQTMKRRLQSGLASRGVSTMGKVIGGTMGATYAASKGTKIDGKDSALGKAITGGATGATLGQGAVAPLKAVANKAEQKIQGKRMEKKITSGAMDKELGLDQVGGAAAAAAAMGVPDVNPDEVVGKHGETMQEIYRQALAEFNKVGSTKGAARGRQAYWNYLEQNIKK